MVVFSTTSIFLILLYLLKNNDFMMTKLIKLLYTGVIFSVVMVFFINPGIPGRKYYQKNYKIKEGITYFLCKKCNLAIPDELNSAHCEKCKICILSHDHHCNWVGKCIGKGNIIFFVGFLISFILFLFTSFFIIFIIFTKINKN